ncbi:asparagine synthase [Clostridium sp. PL3]|uniref:Asparagine synthase n=1 Tax=Clostridium thailandense TaxID=2794346 RepID=A0A949WSS0_9CLOT|nr:asparagine synthase [Clostridium thailandense]MBV7275495.1 asparagine synthase [Clostridium thailandense]
MARKGVIPAVLGTAVTAAGATLTAMEIAPVIATGAIGFGLAHIVLGGLDIARHRGHNQNISRRIR